LQNFYLWGKNNNSDIIELEKYIFNSGDILTYDKMEGILKHNSLLPNSLFSYLSLQNNSNIAQRLSKDGLLITNTSQTEYNIPNGQLGYFNNTEQFLLYKNNKWITLESQIPKILYAKVFYEDVLSNF
jgi:hypothetical protein